MLVEFLGFRNAGQFGGVVRAVQIPVIGVGGICSAEDVLEFVLVGASAVEVGTASFMRPDAAFRIAQDLPHAMETLGVQSLDELRGQLKA